LATNHPREEWSDLVRLSGDSRQEGEFLRRMLEKFCEANGLPAAALYLRQESGLVRDVVSGEGPFPMRLDAEDDAVEIAPLAGGAVAFIPGEEGEPTAETMVGLSTALQVRRLRRKLKRKGFEANLRGVELQALYDVGLAIASTLNLEELSEEVLLRAISLLDARRGAWYLVQGDKLRLNRTLGGDAAASIDADEETIAALLAGEEVENQEFLPGAEYLLVASIEVEGERRGLLLVADKESRTGVGPFTAADRRMLELFANQAAIALENARLHQEALEKERLEREMQLAGEIQKQLLPTLVPEVAGYEFLGWSRPAQQIGGDYYDLIALREGNWGLVVGDVSGKGMPAALMVSTVHSALRLLLDHLDVGPELLERLNRHIAETSAPNKFITFFMAEVDSQRGQVRFMNAGHNPAILMSLSGEVKELETGGLPLGLLPEGSFESGGFDIQPGDLLCIYSDGITEALSGDDEEFGMERLLAVLAETRDKPLASIIAAIDRATAEFAIGMPQSDDQTLLLLRRHSDAE
jgi:sigma-B regulation protein RsbU (phosphoserine phosphatase)